MASNLSLGITIGATLSDSVARAFRGLDARAAQLGQSLRNVRLGRDAAERIIRYRARLEELRATQQQTGGGSAELSRQIARTEAALRNATRRAEEYGLEVGDIVNENRRLLRSEQAIARQLERTNTLRANRERRSDLHGQLLGTIGAAFAAAVPVKKAIEFESVMADVRKVVDLSDAEFKAMGKSILDMSATMPMAASGIGAIVAAAGQSGIAKAELLDFAKSAVMMGVAFDMTGDQSGQMMANWRAGMNLSQAETVALADAVNHLSNNMNATAPAIGEVVQRQGAVAKAAGLSAVQTAALSAALLSSGAAPEIAATALKNLTNALTKGGSATKSQIAVFEELGLTSEAVTSAMQKDAEGTIKKVFAALAKAPAETRGALVGDLFGEEAKGAIAPLLMNMANLTKAFEETATAGNFSGSMLSEYETRSKTTANNLQLLSGQTTRLAINIGSVLLPPLNTIVGILGRGIEGMTGLAEEFPALTTVVVSAAGGLVALKVAALAGGYAATLISDGWVIAKGIMDFFRLSTLRANAALVMQRATAMGLAVQQKAVAVWTGTVTAAQWLWNAALTANPIGLVIAGVVAFGALAVTVYKNWEPIMAWFNEKFPWLGQAIDIVKTGLVNFGAMAVTVYKSWEPVMNWLSEKFAWLGNAWDKFKGITGVFKGPAIGATVAAAVAMPAAAAQLPSVPAASKSTAVVQQTNNATLNITQRPGEDQKQLADRIMAEMKRQQQADQRRALHD